ncbi:MAG: hypothetical protein LRZ85_08365 [Alphaproteobacteria bacterium]|nr:hypothetical protein [Alphaproteobacteria bacterium]MCD8525655.1 hypothetical protein [Alphaproteobacteria bacterium]MCD8570035.1 hypothetical protein [Alphaproteobacteria bacterium]
MDLFSVTSGVSTTQKFAHFKLRGYDPMFARSKFYRDAVISSNIIRKATQLVADIEYSRTVSSRISAFQTGQTTENPFDSILKTRGSNLDIKS